MILVPNRKDVMFIMYDFSQMMAQAQQVVDNAANSGSNYKYQILYPGPGVTTVRLLFNPKSGIATRTVQRHKIGDTQVPCLRTYGQECPICKAIENVKNATGVELKCKSTTRGISFAQFVSADHKVGSDKNPIKTGDIVLLMYPWSVYTEFNKFIQMISQDPKNMQDIFTKAAGPVHIIQRDDNNKYSLQLNPYTPYNSASSDEEFYAIIDGVDSLNDQILPATPTQEMIDQVNKAAVAIEEEYLNTAPSPNMAQQQNAQATDMNAMFAAMMAQQNASGVVNNNPVANPQQAGMMPQMNTGSYGAPQNQAPQYETFTPQNQATIAGNQAPQVGGQSVTNPSSNGMPACYTKHNPDDMNCQICPVEIQCKAASGK